MYLVVNQSCFIVNIKIVFSAISLRISRLVAPPFAVCYNRHAGFLKNIINSIWKSLFWSSPLFYSAIWTLLIPPRIKVPAPELSRYWTIFNFRINVQKCFTIGFVLFCVVVIKSTIVCPVTQVVYRNVALVGVRICSTHLTGGTDQIGSKLDPSIWGSIWPWNLSSICTKFSQ